MHTNIKKPLTYKIGKDGEVIKQEMKLKYLDIEITSNDDEKGPVGKAFKVARCPNDVMGQNQVYQCF